MTFHVSSQRRGARQRDPALEQTRTSCGHLVWNNFLSHFCQGPRVPTRRRRRSVALCSIETAMIFLQTLASPPGARSMCAASQR